MDYSGRQTAKEALVAYAKRINLEGLIGQHTPPFFVFDADIMREQYKALEAALPGVKFYFALKALSIPAAVRAIRACNGYLDVATTGEIELVSGEGFPIDHCMHTHPIKKPEEIKTAYDAGLRRFVVENPTELKKFAGLPDDIELMIRLSYSNPEAKSDLSYKFGATSNEAKTLVRDAVAQGTKVAGFCMHVGSQIHSADAYSVALHETVRLMDELTQELGIEFTILDIGGGFPVEYRESVPTLADIAAIVRPLIEPLQDRLTILAEPGRFIAAPSMLLVASVVGKNTRYEMPWYYLDEGLYDAYSNIIFEQVYPHFFAYKELTETVTPERLQSCVLAGPTCDSVDVLDKGYALPELEAGDLIVSPMMGAYTTVSATNFNSIPKAKVVVINE